MMRFVLICSRSYRDERPRRAGGGKMRSIVVAATTRGTYASRGDRSGPSAGATHSGACVTGILARALALAVVATALAASTAQADRKSTRLNSSHRCISYAVFCL